MVGEELQGQLKCLHTDVWKWATPLLQTPITPCPRHSAALTSFQDKVGTIAHVASHDRTSLSGPHMSLATPQQERSCRQLSFSYRHSMMSTNRIRSSARFCDMHSSPLPIDFGMIDLACKKLTASSPPSQSPFYLSSHNIDFPAILESHVHCSATCLEAKARTGSF